MVLAAGLLDIILISYNALQSLLDITWKTDVTAHYQQISIPRWKIGTIGLSFAQATILTSWQLHGLSWNHPRPSCGNFQLFCEKQNGVSLHGNSRKTRQKQNF